MFKVFQKLFTLPKKTKVMLAISLDALIIAFAFISSLYIRIGGDIVKWISLENFALLVGLCVVSIFTWYRLGLYASVVRHFDIKTFSTIFVGAIGSLFALIFIGFAFEVPLPRSTVLIYTADLIILVTGARLFVKELVDSGANSKRIPVVIYGAGAAGRQLCLSLQNGYEYLPVAFVDDDLNKQKRTVVGVYVYSSEKLKMLVDGMKVKKVLFAIPSINTQQRRKIFNKVRRLGVEMMTIPGSADLVSGRVSVSNLKSVQIEDLLGRDEVKPFNELMKKCITGKTVLVTGAGGSIGSELCRLIIKQKPTRLILFELSEFNIYSIEKELTKNNAEVEVVPIMGSVTDRELLQRLFRCYRIDTVYHAAAYKHVPLVELNVCSGVRNNVWGTKIVAETALEFSVEHFVLISTDKAVRPTNIMGATKRVAELVIQDIAAKSTKTIFSMVRFGNVLGSSGSVIPVFRKQIEQGGPITVTHPDITRYFMTIPEAASLVIQAGAMAEGGDVFVLDMGSPVKIYSLAKKMIELMGFSVKSDETPNGDIEVVFSGLRPGEKLFEELLIGEGVLPTCHERIMRANEVSMSSEELAHFLEDIDNAIKANNIETIRGLFLSAPTGFNPSSPQCDLLYGAELKSKLNPAVQNDGNAQLARGLTH